MIIKFKHYRSIHKGKVFKADTWEAALAIWHKANQPGARARSKVPKGKKLLVHVITDMCYGVAFDVPKMEAQEIPGGLEAGCERMMRRLAEDRAVRDLEVLA